MRGLSVAGADDGGHQVEEAAAGIIGTWQIAEAKGRFHGQNIAEWGCKSNSAKDLKIVRKTF